MSGISDEDREQLRQAARDYLSDNCPEAVMRAAQDKPDGIDRQLWHGLAAQLGLAALVVPAEYGGDGGGPAEVALIAEELGRSLAPVPFMSTLVLAVSALVAAGDKEANACYLPRIAEGDTLASLAVLERSGRWDARDWTTTAEQRDGQWTVSGTKYFVVDGTAADLLLVVARTTDGPSLFAVDTAATALGRSAMTSLDLTRRFARLEFADTPARLVGKPGTAEQTLSAVGDDARRALAAESVGGADFCLHQATDYAKTRHQFGRAIGSFQAVKHMCADMLVETEGARATVAEAVVAARAGSGDASFAALLAFIQSAKAYFFVAEQNIHVHGGIGFTWEHTAHLYFRRAKSNAMLFGGPAVDYQHVLAAIAARYPSYGVPSPEPAPCNSLSRRNGVWSNAFG